MAPTTHKVSNHFPEDLCFSILSKLPLKSLKRFTSVRKSWASLFDNSYFMNMFRNNLLSKHSSFYDEDDMCLLLNGKLSIHSFPCHYTTYLLCDERFEEKVKLDLPSPFQQNDTSYRILGSDGMNGTLCLYNFDHTLVVLWNPASGEFKILPSVPDDPQPSRLTATLHGFGYDYIRDDYKVIRHVTYLYCKFQTMSVDSLWHVYSLRSNSWRELNVNMRSRDIDTVGAEVYLKGACHWLGRAGGEVCVVSFNLSNENFITTHLLSDMHDGFPRVCLEKHFLMVLNGSIAMITKHSETSSFHISILGELGVKESWIKLFIVGPIPYVLYPIGTGKKGDIFFRKQNGELVHFDLCTQTIEELDVNSEFFPCQVAIYKKNLLPIGGSDS